MASGCRVHVKLLEGWLDGYHHEPSWPHGGPKGTAYPRLKDVGA